MNCVICILIGVGFLEKKEIIDTIVEIESQADATLQTLSTLKDEIANLLEENQTLRIENKHLRERLEDQAASAQESQESGGLTKSRLNLESIYEDGFHVCNMFYGQRRVEDEPCAFCLEVIYGER
jgi:regulator of replication initiation timing